MLNTDQNSGINAHSAVSWPKLKLMRATNRSRGGKGGNARVDACTMSGEERRHVKKRVDRGGSRRIASGSHRSATTAAGECTMTSSRYFRRVRLVFSRRQCGAARVMRPVAAADQTRREDQERLTGRITGDVH